LEKQRAAGVLMISRVVDAQRTAVGRELLRGVAWCAAIPTAFRMCRQLRAAMESKAAQQVMSRPPLAA
jgi:hypothetical protein